MKVVIVLRNADFTEGRGPMLFDSVWSSIEAAENYVNSKRYGICGAKPMDGMTRSQSIHSNRDGGWQGYGFQEIELDTRNPFNEPE